MKKLKFSIVISVSGNTEETQYIPCDAEIADFIRSCEEHGFPETEPTEPGDSEYHYLAEESLPSGVSKLHDAFCREVGNFSDNQAAAQWAMNRWPNSREVEFACFSDYQNSAILGSKEFFAFLKNCPVIFEDCGTLGTLGGPLGGIVPDVAFTTESNFAICSMRATPFLEDEDGCYPVTESSWNRLKPFYSNPWKV